MLKYAVYLLPTQAMHSPSALASWINSIDRELVAIDGRNYIFKAEK